MSRIMSAGAAAIAMFATGTALAADGEKKIPIFVYTDKPLGSSTAPWAPTICCRSGRRPGPVTYDRRYPYVPNRPRPPIHLSGRGSDPIPSCRTG